jgi:3-deoxy-D-manno-octulosonic-acid transferase
MAIFFYNLVVQAYAFLIRLAALRSEKARMWVDGRKNWERNLNNKLSNVPTGKRMWVHCASYGEFEQGRPLIEALRLKYPDLKVILSFYSPSGYEAFKSWKGAEVVVYLPHDSRYNANRFVDLVKPDVTIFVKYEFWLHYLQAIKKRNLEAYLISAVFKSHHPFFKWYGRLFRKSLSAFRTLFLQDKASATLLKEAGIHNYEVTGDTRFDRVLEIRKQSINIKRIEKFKNISPLLVAGSTWPADEKLILDAFRNMPDQIKLVLAPHQVSEHEIRSTCMRIADAGLTYARFSQYQDEQVRVLVVDTIGHLSRIYAYATVAYVGGGLGAGLHNILEPAVFGIPVSFAEPRPGRYNESVELLTLGAAKNALTPEELVLAWSEQFFNPVYREQVSKRLENYFQENGNVTEKILKTLSL